MRFVGQTPTDELLLGDSDVEQFVEQAERGRRRLGGARNPRV